MKAVIYDKFGSPDVLHIEDRPRPVPRDREVLIEVHATSVSTGDWRARTRRAPGGFQVFAPLVFGFVHPRHPVLGTELAGEVIEVGRDVHRFRVGDRVFAHTGAGYGCYVEYKCLPEEGPIVLMPSGMTYEEAGTLSFGGMTALAFLRNAKMLPGEHVLVNGASGAVGSAAVQLAKYFGARVTGVCSEANADFVLDLGADDVIDYTIYDFTRDAGVYDVIVDTVGIGFRRARRALKPGGRLLAIGGTLSDLALSPLVTAFSDKRLLAGAPVMRWSPAQRRAALVFLAELAHTGQLHSAIDRRYPLDQIVEAHRYVERGHKRGNVAITVMN